MARSGSSTDVRVRMYRQGLGDCFLITMPRADGGSFQILIDCGVLQSSANASMISDIAHDIDATTRGKLDVVVATHEHWDHLSGFVDARNVFDRMLIDEVWLAWTEDPSDSPACYLRDERLRALQGLRKSANCLQNEYKDHPTTRTLLGLLDLFGRARPRTREALDNLIGHPSRPRVRYHRPGGPPVELPILGDARVYILGPPCDRGLLHHNSRARAGRDVYDIGPSAGFFDAVDALNKNVDLVDESHAFERRYQLKPNHERVQPFLSKVGYLDRDWQKIDNSSWLRAAEQVALNLDNHVNNTSLVLAFELEPGGPVLLFPGDAQVGNWLSWNVYRWRATPPATAVSAADLLSRTVLYKVAHHGSHTATQRERGLELMTSPELVAMLPVCQESARNMGWNMPFPALLNQLNRKTRGRLLRSDMEMPDRPDGVSEAEWAAFADRIQLGPNRLYFDYTI